MSEKLDLNFVKKLQRTVEPQMRPGETAIEAIRRMESEKVASMIQNPTPAPATPASPEPPKQEVVFYRGYKLPRDFFTCMALCIISLNDPEINDILETFGFSMTDLTGKAVELPKRPRRQQPRRKK